MTRYFLTRFIDDLVRGEAKNIGVIVADSEGLMARFIGEKPNGQLDLRSVRRLIAHTQTYKQWIDYWRHIMRKDLPLERRIELLLASSKGNFVIDEGDSIFLPRAVAANRAETLSHLFQLLVSEFPKVNEEGASQLSLTEKCEEIIKRFRLRENEHFSVAPVVEVPLAERRLHFRPSYAWRNGIEIYFQKVSIDAVRFEITQRDVLSTRWMFEKLKEGHEERRLKALVRIADFEEGLGDTSIDPAEFLEALRQVSDDVIDVDREDEVEDTFARLSVA